MMRGFCKLATTLVLHHHHCECKYETHYVRREKSCIPFSYVVKCTSSLRVMLPVHSVLCSLKISCVGCAYFMHSGIEAASKKPKLRHRVREQISNAPRQFACAVQSTPPSASDSSPDCIQIFPSLHTNRPLLAL